MCHFPRPIGLKQAGITKNKFKQKDASRGVKAKTRVPCEKIID
jgi:hypothetical protein